MLDDAVYGLFATAPETLLTPADVASGLASAGAAVRARGWPPADRLRGKFAFALLDSSPDGQLTRAARKRGAGGALFAMGADAADADAALVKFDNPRNAAHYAGIERAVAAGLLVRTRANTVKTVDNPDRFRKARAAGAQLVSFEADALAGWRAFYGANDAPLCACDRAALAGSDRRCDDAAPPCL